MPINTFDTKTEYDEHTKSTTESEVSLIKDLNDVKFDGVNVHVTTPKFGDAVYIDNVLDENGQYRKHFIDGASLNPSLLPNTYTPVGVVIENDKNNVLIVYYKGYNNGDNTQCWCNGALFQIDATIDGTSHSIVFRQRLKSNPNNWVTIGTFIYSCSTQEQFAQELDAWLRENTGIISGDNQTLTYDWHCEYMANYAGVMKPFVICDTISDYRQYSTIIESGSATTILTETDILPTIEKYKRVNTANSERVGINYARLLEYYNKNTTISNPTSMISVKSDSEIVSRTQFNENQYCADLRAAYGTFEEYIKSVMLNDNTLKKGLGQEQGKSLEWTKALAGRKHKNINGELIDTFPCNAWVQSIGFNSKGLRQGDWYLPNASEMYKTIKDVTYGLSGVTLSNCDQLNKTLNKMGGNYIRCNQSVWYCVKRSRYNAWLLYSNGYFNNTNMTYRYRVVAVSLLEL